MQRRDVTCRIIEDGNGTTNASVLDSSKCDESVRPPQRLECYNDACKGVWRVGEWSEVSKVDFEWLSEGLTCCVRQKTGVAKDIRDLSDSETRIGMLGFRCFFISKENAVHFTVYRVVRRGRSQVQNSTMRLVRNKESCGKCM